MGKTKAIRELTERELERFWEKVEKGEGCWLWRGPSCLVNKRYRTRYGVFPVRGEGGWAKKEHYKAHRVAWTLEHGAIREGLTIDHVCKNTMCVNPGHMEEVKQSVNSTRAMARFKGRCRKGHEVNEKGRCLECARRRGAEWRAKNPERAQAIVQRYYASEKGKAARKARDARWRESVDVLIEKPSPGDWRSAWR